VAFWDPFGHVNKMPVALVNSDRALSYPGSSFNAGTEIAKSLTADGSLDWHVVSPEEAHSGVEHGKYYFMVELPPDFSAAIASPVTGQTEKGQPDRRVNDANNYISTSIAPYRDRTRCSTPSRPGSPGRRSIRCCPWWFRPEPGSNRPPMGPADSPTAPVS